MIGNQTNQENKEVSLSYLFAWFLFGRIVRETYPRKRRGLAKVVATLYLRCSYRVATHGGGLARCLARVSQATRSFSRGRPSRDFSQLLAGAPCSRSFSRGRRVFCPFPPFTMQFEVPGHNPGNSKVEYAVKVF